MRFAGVFSAGILLLAAYRRPAPEAAMSVYVMDEFARVRPRVPTVPPCLARPVVNMPRFRLSFAREPVG
jgi:hypothetical protein